MNMLHGGLELSNVGSVHPGSISRKVSDFQLPGERVALGSTGRATFLMSHRKVARLYYRYC